MISAKKIAVSQSNYIPWKGYFDAIHTVDTFVLFDDAQYTKRDWRNRNLIKTKDGPQWLTIPVEVKGKFTQTVRQTKISEPRWAERHWKTIAMNYCRAPYFKQLEKDFEELYVQAGLLISLSDINFLFLKRICDILNFSTPLIWSSDFELLEQKTERLIHVCRQAGATDYYSGPTARNYLDESLFRRANIAIHYFDYGNYPQYHQLFGEFVHEVSVIDLLFNEGPFATKYMKSFQTYD